MLKRKVKMPNLPSLDDGPRELAAPRARPLVLGTGGQQGRYKSLSLAFL